MFLVILIFTVIANISSHPTNAAGKELESATKSNDWIFIFFKCLNIKFLILIKEIISWPELERAFVGNYHKILKKYMFFKFNIILDENGAVVIPDPITKTKGKIFKFNRVVVGW